MTRVSQPRPGPCGGLQRDAGRHQARCAARAPRQGPAAAPAPAAAGGAQASLPGALGALCTTCASGVLAGGTGQGQAPRPCSRRTALLAALLAASAPALLGQAPRARAQAEPSRDAVLAALQKSLKSNIDKGKDRADDESHQLMSQGGDSQAPVLLRLVFHDAATHSVSAGDGGANASVRFELKRPENTGLIRGWRVIERVQEGLRGTAAEGRVSAADLIAFCGAHAVAITGGPTIPLALGRVDAVRADPEHRMPEESLSAPAQRAAFAEMGFTPQELAALSGAHTLGNKGFGDPLTFDNAYYAAALARPWEDPGNEMRDMIGLASDRVLAADPVVAPFLAAYARDQALFFRDFAAAYVKLTGLGAVWA